MGVGDGGCERGALKQPRGLFRELLRLTVSLWSLPCARLEPGGVFQEVRFSSVFPGPCDKSTGMAATTPPVRTAVRPRGKTIFWLFTRTPVEWGTFGRRKRYDAFATGFSVWFLRGLLR